MVIDFKGEENLYRNAVLNCIEVLKDNFADRTGRHIRKFYEEDVVNPITPSMSVLVVSSEDELRESQALRQMRYTVNIGLEVWYYHADLTEETKRNEVTYILWEINSLLKDNITLNGFVPKLGVEVLGARWVPRKFANSVVAGGVISLLVKKLHTVPNAS
jgi:hypothetical protein